MHVTVSSPDVQLTRVPSYLIRAAFRPDGFCCSPAVRVGQVRERPGIFNDHRYIITIKKYSDSGSG